MLTRPPPPPLPGPFSGAEPVLRLSHLLFIHCLLHSHASQTCSHLVNTLQCQGPVEIWGHVRPFSLGPASLNTRQSFAHGKLSKTRIMMTRKEKKKKGKERKGKERRIVVKKISFLTVYTHVLVIKTNNSPQPLASFFSSLFLPFFLFSQSSSFSSFSSSCLFRSNLIQDRQLSGKKIESIHLSLITLSNPFILCTTKMKPRRGTSLAQRHTASQCH